MKTLFRILAVTVAIFSLSFSSNAADVEPLSDNSKVVITTNADAVMTLRLFNLDMEVTEIKIKNVDGDMVYFKKVKNNEDFASRINLSQLEDGTYNLYINRKQVRFVQPLTKEGDALVIGQLKEVIKPIFSLNEKNFTVTQKGLLIENVSILDVRGNVVYTQNFDKSVSQVSKLQFNLADNFSGKYTVRIQTADENYYNDLEVK